LESPTTTNLASSEILALGSSILCFAKAMELNAFFDIPSPPLFPHFGGEDKAEGT
jgi:hypothetical protein